MSFAHAPTVPRQPRPRHVRANPPRQEVRRPHADPKKPASPTKKEAAAGEGLEEDPLPLPRACDASPPPPPPLAPTPVPPPPPAPRAPSSAEAGEDLAAALSEAFASLAKSEAELARTRLRLADTEADLEAARDKAERCAEEARAATRDRDQSRVEVFSARATISALTMERDDARSLASARADKENDESAFAAEDDAPGPPKPTAAAAARINDLFRRSAEETAAAKRDLAAARAEASRHEAAAQIADARAAAAEARRDLAIERAAEAKREGVRRERVRHELLAERDAYATKLEMEVAAAKVKYAELATDYDVHLGSIIRSAKHGVLASRPGALRYAPAPPPRGGD